jgi:hypothetical protein
MNPKEAEAMEADKTLEQAMQEALGVTTSDRVEFYRNSAANGGLEAIALAYISEQMSNDLNSIIPLLEDFRIHANKPVSDAELERIIREHFTEQGCEVRSKGSIEPLTIYRGGQLRAIVNVSNRCRLGVIFVSVLSCDRLIVR